MANLGIREYDAKKMFFSFINQKYSWVKIVKISDFDWLDSEKKYVIKPDQLFGKRWKLWLVWVKLSLNDTKNWILEKSWKEIQIKNSLWILDTFLLIKILLCFCLIII